MFITHDSIIFGGEATTTLKIDRAYLRSVVKKGFKASGYLSEMRKYWTKSEVLLPSNFNIINKICAQSPDIALGTTDLGEDSGWNDQGVFFSSAENTNSLNLGTAHYIAMRICGFLQNLSAFSIHDPEKTDNVILGPDNKAVVTVKVGLDGFTPIEITAVTIAVAHSSLTPINQVREYVRNQVTLELKRIGIPIAVDCHWVINGTGRFVVHGPISDTSMTGRKISVNHPSAGPLWANKMIGGGSLVKPAHASDLILNIASRFIANVIVNAGLSSYAIVGCSGAIGRHGLQSLFINGDAKFEKSSKKSKVIKFFEENIEWSPIAIANMFNFFTDDFNFLNVVNNNF